MSEESTVKTLSNGYSLPKRIAITYSDVKREYFPTEAQFITEKDAEDDAKAIALYTEKMGITTHLYPGNASLLEKLKIDKPEMVINLVDSVEGNEYLSSVIPATLELLDIPYTGTGILGMSLDTNKFLGRKLFAQVGIPIPSYQLFNSSTDPLDPTLKFPLISKLNEIHGAVEITKDSVSDNEKHLRERIKFLIETYDQPVLVEEFIVGREITGILLQGLNKKVYLAEKVFHKPDEKYVFASFEDQWVTEGYGGFHYQRYDDPVLKGYIKRAFDISKMADYGKFDVRLDNSGRYYFIDSNCNPAFGPKELSCAISNILDLYGVSFEEILKRLIINTLHPGETEDQKS